MNKVKVFPIFENNYVLESDYIALEKKLIDKELLINSLMCGVASLHTNVDWMREKDNVEKETDTSMRWPDAETIAPKVSR